MNDKVKELAFKCYNPYGEFDYQKFAELIVRDCDLYARSTWEHGELLGRDLLVYFGFEQ